ncbi:hypothetical protein AQJ23_16315 [Streptomyces antibioticus]|nr:hypothetical protein [Streptomyces antibioticus]KUN25450.1 hypothetical protein AQJ23_16315 [Streptomyces antibioticus]
MTGNANEAPPPIDEDLVRERGDVVAAARAAAEQAQYQAAQLLGSHPLHQPHPPGGVTSETTAAL